MNPFSPSDWHVCHYLRELLRDRRVVALGDATSELGEMLLEAGARQVMLMDAERARVATALLSPARPRLSVAHFDHERLLWRQGAFDHCWLRELGDYQHPATILRRLPALVGEQGLVSVGNQPKRGLSYFDLFDSLSLTFRHVRMVVVTPFSGVLLQPAEGGGARPIDPTPAPRAEPEEWHLALASQRPLPALGGALLPSTLASSNLAERAGGQPEGSGTPSPLRPLRERVQAEALEHLQGALAASERKREQLSQQVKLEERERLQRLQAEAARRQAGGQQPRLSYQVLEQKLEACEARAAHMALRISQLESPGQAGEGAASEAQEQLIQSQRRSEHLHELLRATREELARVQSQNAQLRGRLSRPSQSSGPDPNAALVSRAQARGQGKGQLPSWKPESDPSEDESS